METQLGLSYGSVIKVLSELVEIGFVVMNDSGEIDFASPRACSLLGCEDDSRLAACLPAVRAAFRETFDELKTGDRTSVEREVRFDVDGKDRHLRLEAQSIDESDCTGVLVLVKDAETIRRMALDLRMSAQFRNTRRLYQAVVHDLKQPITAVLVHLDLLRQILDTPDEVDENRVVPGMKSIRIIKEQVTELNRTLNLLLEEIQPAETEERGLSLRDVLEDVARLIEPQAIRQGVSVTLHTGEHSARMTGSRQRVKQAFLNLAVNALDAMTAGGDLVLALDVDAGKAEIRVKDTGTGIPPDVLPHIFEIHYTTKETGTGAGLYVARDVIRRHGGDITVETEVDEGSCFVVTLAVSENGS